MMQSIKRASDLSPFPLVPAAPWSRVCSQRPSGNGDCEAIVVGAVLCDGEGERAYTGWGNGNRTNMLKIAETLM